MWVEAGSDIVCGDRGFDLLIGVRSEEGAGKRRERRWRRGKGLEKGVISAVYTVCDSSSRVQRPFSCFRTTGLSDYGPEWNRIR